MLLDLVYSTDVDGQLRQSGFPSVHPNALPPNWKEISEREFTESAFFIYSPIAVEFKQAPLIPNGPLENIKMFYVYGYAEGFAMVADHEAGRVRYFLFAECEHDWQDITTHRFLHTIRCRRCPETRSFDSSD